MLYALFFKHCAIIIVLFALCSCKHCNVSTVFDLIFAFTDKKLAQPRRKIGQPRLQRLHVFPSLSQSSLTVRHGIEKGLRVVEVKVESMTYFLRATMAIISQRRKKLFAIVAVSELRMGACLTLAALGLLFVAALV